MVDLQGFIALMPEARGEAACLLKDEGRRRSGGSVEAGDLGFNIDAPAVGFLLIGEPRVEIGPHRLAVEFGPDQVAAV
jgi:hypothetical protein